MLLGYSLLPSVPGGAVLGMSLLRRVSARAINRWQNVRLAPNSGRVASVLKESA
jgi:hypothetical protein